MLTAIVHVHALGAGAPTVPNPGPVPIPGLAGPLDTVIGGMKWALVFAGIIGLLICAGQMMVGRRNRHSFAADGAAGIPWVIGGLSLAFISSGIVSEFLHL
jgi:hypothetical protein